MTIRLVVLHTGQSNCLYLNRGEAGSAIPAVGYFAWYWGVGGSPSNGTFGAMVDLVGKATDTGGADYTIGRLLNEANIPCAIIDLTATGTYYTQWDPAEPLADKGREALVQLGVALTALKARYPGDVFEFVHLRNQGTSDALVDNETYQDDWAPGFETWHTELTNQVTTTMGRSYAIPRFIIESNPNQPSVFFPGSIQAAQALAAGDGHLIQLRDDAGYESGLHMIGTSCVITTGLLPGTYSGGGFQWLGTVVAQNYLIPYWRSIMGSLSTYAKNKMVDHVRNVATHTPAATHYVHLYSAGSVPISGNGYAAVSVTNNTTTWPNAASRVKSHGIAFTFPTPTGTWADVTEVRITDSATEGAGNVIASDTFTAVPVSVATGPFSIAIGAFTITAPTNVAAGGFTNAVVHGLLNLMFGGTAYTQLATTYGSYWTGDPADAGTQAGSRVAITQASTWAAASGGVALTSAAITLADQATGTYWAEHDASSAGNLLFTCTRASITGASGSLVAGQLKTTLT